MKRFLGILLSVAVLVTVLWVSPVEAYAATPSHAQLTTQYSTFSINGSLPKARVGGNLIRSDIIVKEGSHTAMAL